MTLNNVARPDLCVSYKKIAPPKGLYSATPSISGVVNQSMPMAAIFLRNKFIAWFSLIPECTLLPEHRRRHHRCL
ncbi:BEM_collapsed_G0058110.mRNA.1.CDS.1 [Saccharomyces cerevisiae]|nr:BEM_collapsed_G0058110.mRNA.1.CDS.1 [Saccharomyces cerevisiae]